MKRVSIFCVAVLVCVVDISICPAQFQFAQNQQGQTTSDREYGPQPGSMESQIWRCGIVIEAGADMTHVVVTTPIPMEWPEQKIVKVNEEKIDAALSGKIRYQNVDAGAREMILNLGKMRPHRAVEIVVAFELQNYTLLPPEKTDVYVIPKKAPRGLESYLKESPKIECKKAIFKNLYNQITKDKETDWEKIEAIYRYVQDNVNYNDARRADEALGAYAVTQMPQGQWEGDCKDMCCLFVAICRAGMIPARIVRVPEHCYAEFYLELKEGIEATGAVQDEVETADKKTRRPVKVKTQPGFWFPCQVAGDYSFGGIPERRVILQKGDSYQDKEKDGGRARKLFLNECFEGILVDGSPKPKFRWVHEVKAY